MKNCNLTLGSGHIAQDKIYTLLMMELDDVACESKREQTKGQSRHLCSQQRTRFLVYSGGSNDGD